MSQGVRYDFVDDIAEDTNENEASKGFMVRNKKRKLDEFQQSALSEWEGESNYPITQRLQPTETSLDTDKLSEKDYPILKSILLGNDSPSIKQKRRRRRRRRKNRLNNTPEMSSVKRQLFPSTEVNPVDKSQTKASSDVESISFADALNFAEQQALESQASSDTDSVSFEDFVIGSMSFPDDVTIALSCDMFLW